MKIKNIALLLVLLIFTTVTCPSVAGAVSKVELEDQAQAQWHINYASYLIDVGKYFESLEQYDTAIDYTPFAKTRVQALFGKAMVLSTFLDAQDKAADIYVDISKKYPESAETAIYKLAFLYSQDDEPVKAQKVLDYYLKKYPSGKYRFQVEAVLSSVKRELAAIAAKKKTDEDIAAETKKEETKPESKPATKPAVDEKKQLGDEPSLRVCLSRKVTKMTVTTKGSADKICTDDLGCGKKYNIKISNGALVLNGKKVTAASIRFRSNTHLIVGYGKSKKKVRGDISVRVSKGRLLILNNVKIEDYLRSVVPAESYASWPQEALKAQSVAARTYAYYQKKHRTHLDYDVYADTYDQMYGGVDREDKRTDKALKSTHGQVLMYKNKPILSQYTANSGGVTADAKAIFGAGKAYLVSHDDPASLKGKMASWTRSFTVSQIEAKLAKIGISVPGIKSIKSLETGPSGRIIKARINYSGGHRDLRTRTTLGSSRVLNLPDILLSITKSGNKYIFKGNGYGHGVGYSQWGSAELGKTKDYETILEFYYPKTSIKQLW
ncbi:SpoIID/LytB domain-containing protein [Maridesulfovibrio bastinii]|uniref:SpoIID/LytB domain-containing protein n=1 Tax=Maridesulfovibrio bastinii TaxID=47157 RepID=UPI00042088E6|nr:SpoIID/LytB domain-containing protein [Maridesulfovibrio bastinii]